MGRSAPAQAGTRGAKTEDVPEKSVARAVYERSAVSAVQSPVSALGLSFAFRRPQRERVTGGMKKKHGQSTSTIHEKKEVINKNPGLPPAQ